MSIMILYSLIIAIIGLLIYFFASGKWQEVGRIMFAAGMFAFCYQLGGWTFSAGTGR